MSRSRLPGRDSEVTCSFCGTARTPLEGRIIGGPHGRYICGGCVVLLSVAAAEGSVHAGTGRLYRASPRGPDDAQEPAGCDFCGKPVWSVRWIVAGQAAVICDECGDLCLEILSE